MEGAGVKLINTDGLAFIGRNPGDEPNVYIATGDSGAGLTHGTIAGMLLRDLILGRNNPWTTLYDPARKSLRTALTFAKENLNVAGQYAAWMTPGDVGTPEKIKPGMGAVIRRGVSKIAVYRDDAGKLHERSAVCPHLGCIVSWNSTERSWDCPCHGSRFEPGGKVYYNKVEFDAVPAQGGTLCTNGKWQAADGSASGTTPFRVFIKDGVKRRSP
jgi:Rieske Fe-S protein